MGIWFPMWVEAQDLIQKTDNSTISCKVVEITETSIIYKSWDYLTGPNRSLMKSAIVKIIFEDGHVEFFNKKDVNESGSTNLQPNQPSVQTYNTSTARQTHSDVENPTLEKLEYAPSRVTYGFNSLGYVSAGVDVESRIISDYVNLGLGYWGHSFMGISDLYYSSFRVYTSIFIPVNKLTGNLKTINRGFFPFFQPGVDMVLQFPAEGGTLFFTDFVWSVGTDYYFTDKFGISYSYSNGSLNNFGISFRW